SPSTQIDFGMGLGFAIKNGSPLQSALSIALFLVLGWTAIGLLILSVNQITQNNKTGLLAGALVILLAVLGSIFGGPIGGQGWESYFLIQNHLEYTPLWAPVRVISESASWIFWLVWIFLCVSVGWISARRSDFLAVGS
ncbi:MAG: hypothetical protein LWX83_17455, partial [Anaerolineae bacterium]|nr:hypothetical protein [Anaerolineae bacterium]